MLSLTVLMSLPIWGASLVCAQPIIPATDGVGTIVTPYGDQFNINGGTQAGANLFHSFQQFGLTSGQTANFLATPELQNILGRVVGGDPSTINGLIQVSGGTPNLYLLNPAGIIFGQNASLNVPASFTATTATGIGFGTDNWFNTIGSNNYATLVGDPSSFLFDTVQPGSIVNAGTLTVGSGQSLNLIGGTVVNTGTLHAPSGSITVLAVPGSSLVRLSQPGSLLSLDIDPVGVGLVANAASVSAISSTSPLRSPLSLPQLLTGGELAAQATGVLVDADGTVRLVNTGTVVQPTAGTTIVSGTLSVASPTPSTQTPHIALLGDRVGLFSATIDASSSSGGSTVLIGGDYKGQGSVPNAQFTIVDPNSTIRVDALTSGNGGRAIVWADHTTRFGGTITAKGGLLGGDGGFVEVSGKNSLVFTGFVNTSSPLGRTGTLLLDPTNITVVDGGPFNPAQLGANDPTIWGAGFGDPMEDVGDQTIGTADIRALLGVNSLILEASNNINWQATLDYDGLGTGKTLTLRAGNDIRFDFGAGITDSVAGGDALNLVLNADRNNDNLGSVSLEQFGSISTGGGNIVIGGGVDPLTVAATATTGQGVYIGKNLDSGGGNITINGNSSTSDGIWVRGDITSGAGTVRITGNTIQNSSHGIVTTGTITSGNGNIILTGNNTGIFGDGRGVFVQFGGITSTGGNIAITGNHAGSGRGVDISAGTSVTSGTGTITVAGSAVGPNVNDTAGLFVNGTVISSSGNIALTGSGNSSRGIWVVGNVETTTGTVQFAGSSSSEDGIRVSNGGRVSTAGSAITFVGNSSTGGSNLAAINIENASSVDSNGGNITFLGTNTGIGGSGDGVRVRGVVESDTGNIFFQGTSGSSRGIRIDGETRSTTGNVTLEGTSTSPDSLANGVELKFSNSITTVGGAISIAGNSIYGIGAFFNGTPIASNGGSITVTGTTAASGSAGVRTSTSTGSLNSGGGNITIVGRNTSAINTGSGHGVILADQGFTTGGGNFSVTGEHGGNGIGIEIFNHAVFSSTGNITVLGNSAGGIGVYTRGSGILNSTTGAIQITGTTADGNQQGVLIQQSPTSSGGAITIVGNNTGVGTGRGVQLDVGVNSAGGDLSIIGRHASNGLGIESRDFLASGSGNLTLDGTSAGEVGLSHQGTILTSGGDVRLLGNTADGSKDGVQVAGDILSFGGDITITGNNTGTGSSGRGVALGFSPINVNSDGGTITVTGITTSGGAGIESQANVTAGFQGDIVFTGTTDGGSGIWVRNDITSNGGDIQFTGTTNNGDDRGIVLTRAVTSNGGDISFLGTNTGATGTGGQGIFFAFGSGGVNSAGGDISLTGNTPNNVNIPGIQNIDSIVADAGNITLTADRTILQSSVSGTGNLTVQPLSPPTDMVVGTNAADLTTFLNNSEINNLNFGNYQSITIGRADSTGLLTIPENRTIPDNLILRSPGTGSSGIVLNGSLDMTGNNLTINSGGLVTQAAGAPILNTNGLELLGSGEFLLTNANNAIATLAGNMTGNATYQDIDGFQIGTVNATIGFTTTQNLALSSPALVTQTQAITASGLALLGSGSYDLTLATNNVQTLAANTNTINFRDANDLAIGAVPSAFGTVTGITTSNDDITIQTGGNLAINQAVAVGAANVTLTVGGNATQAAAGAITANTLELLGTGSFTLTNPTNDVDLLAGNTTGAVSYTDANDLTIGVVNATTGLTTANGAIVVATVNGPLTVVDTPAVADVNAGGSTVSLTAGGANQLLTINGGAAVVGTGGVTLVGDNIALNGTVNAGTAIATLRQFSNGQLINLGGADAAGTLGLTDAELDRVTAGVIRVGNANSGNIAVTTAINPANSGTLSLQTSTNISQTAGSTLTVGNLALQAVGNVTLTQANDVNNLAANTTGTITFTDANALNIGTVDSINGITTTGNLTLTTGGILTDSSVLTIAGTTTLTTATSDILLDTLANDFSTIVIVSAGNATLVDANNLNMGNAAVSGNLTITTNGNLTDSGNLVVAGTTSLNTSGGNVVLDSANNNFATITIANTANATLTDVNALNFGNISITGNLTTTTGGLLTQTAGTSINVPGVASFTTTHAAGNVTLREGNDTVLGNSTIGGDFTLTSAGNISQAPGTALKVAGNITPNSAGTTTLTNPNNVLPTLVLPNGDVVINQVGTVNLPTRTVTGNLTVISKATGEQFAGVVGGDAIVLDNTGNSFGQLNLNTANAGLSIIAGTPEIIQSGIQTVAGTTTLDATAGGNITLNLANQFNGNVAIAAGNNVSLTNAPNLALGNSTVSGNLAVQVTAGNLIDNGTTTVAGNASFTTTQADADITLDQLAVTGTIAVNTTGTDGNATLNTPSGLTLATSTVGGTLDITSGGNILDSGTLTVAGNTRLTAATNDIILDTLANDFSTIVIVSAGNVTLVDANALNMGNTNITGNLTITTAGNLTDSGNVVVAGTTLLNSGANDIVLDSAGNNFSTLRFTAANITLVDANDLDLGTSSATNSFAIAAGGNLTDSGDLTLLGIGSNTLTAGNITLNNNNDIARVSVVTTGDALLNDINAINLNTSTVGGNFTVTALNGNITDSGSLTVAGTTTLAVSTATNRNIFLDNVSNFNTVVVTSANDVILNDANNLDLGASTINGTLTVTTAGNLTDSGALTVFGNTNLTAGTGNITLNDANNFSTVRIASATNATLNDVNALNLGNITLTGDLTVTAGGLITQSGGTTLTVPGNASFATTLATAGTVRLTNSAAGGTSFGNSQVGGNLLLDSTGAGTVNSAAGALLVTGSTNITSNGTILIPDADDGFGSGVTSVSGTGDVVVSGVGAVVVNIPTPIAGNLTVNSYAQGNTFTAGTVYTADAIVLTNATNTFGGTLRLNTDFNGVVTPVTGTPSITQAATITMADPTKTASFNAVQSAANNTPAGAITLTDPANQFGVITIRGTDISLRENAATVLSGGSVAGNLTVRTDAGSITDSGAVTIAGTATFTTTQADTDITLDQLLVTGAIGVNTTGAGGDATISVPGALTLAASTVGGNLTVTGGPISDSGNLVVGGTTSLNAGTNTITLDNANNFATVSIVNAGNAALNDVNALTLGGTNVTNNLTVTTGGDLTDNGTLTIGGTTSLNAGTNTITLDNANNFATVSIVNAGNATLNDINALTLGTSNVTNNLTVTTGGDLTDSGNLVVGGITSLNAGTSAITLDNANNFGTVSIVNAGNATLTDINALTLGTSNVTNNLTVTTGGDLTDSGALTIGGTTSLNAGTNTITLDNANNFATVSIVNAGNATLNDVNALTLGTSNVTNNLTVTTGGDLTDSGTLTIGGTTSLNAGTNTITLDNANNFATVSIVNAGSATLNDVDALNFGNTNVTGNLTVVTSGALTDSGNLTIGGTTILASGTGDIALNSTSNNFNTVVITNANNAILVDQNAITFGNITVGNDFSITAGGVITQAAGTRFVIPGDASFTTTHAAGNVAVSNGGATTLGDTTIGGDFTLTSTGNITQAAGTALQVAGAVNLNTSANVVLSNTGNILPDLTLPNGDVIITRVGIIDLPTRTVTGSLSVNSQATGSQFNGVVNGDAIVLTQSTNSFGGTLSLNTANAGTTALPAATPGITQSGVLTVAGTTALNATPAGNITLNLANNLNTVQVIGGNNIVVNNTAGLSLGTSTIAGNATFTANGAITDVGNLTIAGTTNLNAGTNPITLDNTNDFATVTIGSGTNVTLNDINSLSLGNATVAGNLTIVVGDNLTGNGRLVVAGNTSLTASGNITLANANNDFNTISILNGTNVTLANSDALNFGATTVAGNLTVTTIGNITQSDALTVGNTASFSAGNGNIVLSDAGNQFGSLSLNGNNADIQVNADLALGLSDLTGNLTVTVLTGNLAVSGNVTVDDDILLTADGITLNALLAGAGNLTLQPLDPTLDVGIGVTTGGFDLSAASLGNLADGFTQITIGQIKGTGTISLGTITFTDPVLIPSGAELVGPNGNITWNVTGTDSGNLNTNFPNGLRFTNIGNLTAGSGSDVFVFANGATISGIIDGGDGVDRLDYSAYTTAVTVNLADNTATGTGGIRNFEGLTGGQSNNTLIGANTPNTWTLTGQNQGTVGTFIFEAIQNLTGGSAKDVFIFTDGAVLSGIIDGSAGFDTLDYSAYTTSVTVDLAAGTATSTGGIRNIEEAIVPATSQPENQPESQPESQPQSGGLSSFNVCKSIAAPEEDPVTGHADLVYCENDTLAEPQPYTIGDPILHNEQTAESPPTIPDSQPAVSPTSSIPQPKALLVLPTLDVQDLQEGAATSPQTTTKAKAKLAVPATTAK